MYQHFCNSISLLNFTLKNGEIGAKISKFNSENLLQSRMGVEKGASFVRVHDVKENMRAIKMTEAILGE